ncbi:hypothetical protein ACVS9X_001428 [Cronobacter malonaticus]
MTLDIAKLKAESENALHLPGCRKLAGVVLDLIAALEATEQHAARGWREAHEQEARAEAAEKRIAELEEQKAKWVLWAEQSSGEVDKARQRIADLESKLAQSESWSVSAKNYIASLEARKFRLPESVIDAICHTAAEIHNLGRGVSDDRAQEIINSIRCAACINLETGG